MSRFSTHPPIAQTDAERQRLDDLDDPTVTQRALALQSRRRLPGDRALLELLETLTETNRLTLGHTTELLSLLQGMGQNGVTETATMTFPASGIIERKYPVPFAGLFLVNATGSTITVQEGSALGPIAQGDGPGSFRFPAGSVLTVPIVGRSLFFYGPPGARVSFSVLSHAPQPVGSYTSGGGAALAEPSALLLAGGIANGATRATAGYSRLRGFASSDQAGTINMQQSRDGLVWYTTSSGPVAAGSAAGTVVESILAMPFARAQYVNGAAAQGSFEFDSMLVAI